MQKKNFLSIAVDNGILSTSVEYLQNEINAPVTCE